VKCVPELKGAVPEDDHWECPRCTELEKCVACNKRGEVILCDNLQCSELYHPQCAGLEAVPEGRWFCPTCVRARESCLVCAHCGGAGDGSLARCGMCATAVHARCVPAYAKTLPSGVSCGKCAVDRQHNDDGLPKQLAVATIELQPGYEPHLDRLAQLLRGELQDLTADVAVRYLERFIDATGR